MSSRTFSLIFLALGGFCLFKTVKAEITGTTSVSSMGRSLSRTVSKGDVNPDFRSIMAFNWIVSLGLLGAGWFALALDRHYERHDLLSTKFDSTGGE